MWQFDALGVAGLAGFADSDSRLAHSEDNTKKLDSASYTHPFTQTCAVSSAATTAKATSPLSAQEPSLCQSSSDTEVRIGRDVTWPRTRSSSTSDWPLSVLVSDGADQVRQDSLPDTGAQPLVNDDETIILAVNGEIYNHVALRKSLKNPATFKTHSDCEVIMHLVRLRPCDGADSSTKSTAPACATCSTACSPSSSSTRPLPPLD